MKKAKDCLSSRVVTVSPSQRLADVADLIAEKDANYCSVVDKAGKFLGLVRLREILGRSANRLFADLLPGGAPLDINENMDAELVAKLLQSQGCDEVVVLTAARRYVGLVTRESLFDWWTRRPGRPLSGL